MKILSYLFLEDIEKGVLEICTKKFEGRYHLVTRLFKFTSKYQPNNFRVEADGFDNPEKVHFDFIKKIKGEKK